MERHTRLSRVAVVLVAIALIAAIAAAVWFASPESPYVPSEDSGAALGTAAPAEDGTVAEGYQPSSTSTGISDNGTPNSAITTIRSSLASNKSYHLTDNITVTSFHTSTEWTNEYTFGKATLDGAGHTITIDAKSTGSNADVGGLFMGLRDGAVIKNLTIKVTGFSFGVSGKTLSAGIIAGYASGTNITIQNVKVILDHDTSNSSTSSQDNYAYNTNQADAITIRLGGLVGKVEKGTTTVKNVTVHNSAGGTYGFSAQSWTTNPTGVFDSDSTSQLSVGGFVGDVMDNGDLDAYQITYSTDGTGKISAVGEAQSGNRSNQGLVGGVVGYLSNGSVDISGLVIDVPGAIDTLFTGHNMNTTYSGGFVVGHKNSAPTLLMSGIIVNDKSKIGNGAVDENEYLVGNDGIWSGRVTYPSDVVEAVRFSSDGTPMFAIAKKAPTDATGIVAEIYQHQISIANPAQSVDEINWKESGLTSQFVAQDESEVGQLVWITLPKLTTTGSNDYELLVNYSTSSTYSVVTDSAGSITSVDGTTYNGTKVYDGTMVKTPTLNVGGTTVNAWTADSTTADVGTKTFSYNASALSGYAAAAYNGGTYLVKDGTIYSPGNINVGGASQTFTLGNAFSYTITPMPMNSVAVSVSETKFYEGEALLDEWLTVTSTDPSGIDGTAKWDEGQTLSTQTTTYNWTWTPNSDNYKSYSGTVELQVFEKQIVSIEVTNAPKTDYVAYDAFDPTGIEVTATYSDDSTAVLTDECAFKIVGANGNEVEGGIDKLFVSYDEVTVYLLSGSEVTTTIPINVDYVRFVVEQKAYNKNITYGDSYQWNAADFYTWSDNTEVVDTFMDFYEVGPDLTDDISGIATADAGTKFFGRVLGRAIYKGEEVPEAEYDNFLGINNPDEIASEVTLTIVPREIELKSSGIASGVYSGEPVDLSTLFTAQSVNDDVIGLSFDITLNNETCDEVRGAGTYSIAARLAESETNYTAEPVTITYTVTKLAIPKPQDAEEPIVYDGTEHDVTPTVPEYKVVNGTTKETDAGNYSVTIALTDKANTEWEDGTSDDITVTWSITPATVKITGEDSSKTYDGNVVAPSSLFTAPQGVDGGALALTVTIDGGKEILNAGTYSVTASLAESVTNYTADPVTIDYTVETIKVSGSVAFTTSEIYDGTEKVAEFTLTSPDVLIGDDKVTITYSVEDRTNVTGEAITATAVLPSATNYQWQDGVEPTASLTIVKATPGVTVKLSDDMPGNLTVAATLDNTWLVRTDNTGVEGTLTWDKAGELLQQGKVEYGWTFVPTDSNNYNNATGSLSITASEDTLQSITVKDGTYKTEYTAYEDFDPTGLVVIAHYMSGAEVEVTSGFTLENDKALTDGEITVTLNGVSTTIAVTVNKREIPLPAATEGLIFNGEEQNGIDQKWIEQYAKFVKVEGNSQRDAGDYRATVTLTKDTNYVTWEGGSAADVSIPWTIAPMTLDGTVLEPGSLEYDGNAKEAAFDLTTGTLFGSDQVTFEYGGADRVNVTVDGFTATAQLPGSGNYKWATDAPSASFTIVPMPVVIGKTADLSKTYDGLTVDPDTLFTAPNGVGGGALELTVTVDGGEEILNAGSYTVTAVLAQGQSNYTAEQAVAEYNVSKADPTVAPTADVQGTLYTSDDLYKIALNLGEQDTPGTVSWDKGQRLTAGEQGYNWTFVPTDSVNYNGATGVIKLTAVQAVLTGIRVSPSAQAEYTAYDEFDRGDIVVEAVYGDVVRAVGDYELSFSSGTEGRLVAGEITVTVTYTDGDVTQSTEFTIDVAKRVVAKPVVDTTVFDATGETITLPIAESDYYTVEDNTAIEPGRYVATVELKDPANTMWADGSVDDISIAWTITEPVTSDEVIADILAMEKVTWQNAEEFLDLEERYNALDESEQTAEATAKLATLKAQYDALRNAAFDDIEAAHEVTAKSLGKALAAAAAGLSAAAIALAIAKRRSI